MKLCKREFAALTLAGSAIPLNAVALDTGAVYPERPMTLVVGYPAGGGNDFLARVLAKHMGDELGQKMIVEFRPGAAGNIGAEAVARTTPDGYTIYLGARPNTIHKVMYPRIKYDFTHDLLPVGLVARTPYVMIVGKHSSITGVQDLVALAQADPGRLTCASGGTGTTDHLLCELLQQEAGIDMVHVPYRGSTPVFVDLIGGRVDMYVTPVSSALPHIAAGSVRAIAVMSSLRAPALKDIPTIGEAGLPGLALGSWYGLMAPAGTPPDVVARLNRSITTVLESGDLREALVERAYVVPSQPNTPEMFKDLIAEETARWTAVLRERHIQPLH